MKQILRILQLQFLYHVSTNIIHLPENFGGLILPFKCVWLIQPSWLVSAPTLTARDVGTPTRACKFKCTTVMSAGRNPSSVLPFCAASTGAADVPYLRLHRFSGALAYRAMPISCVLLMLQCGQPFVRLACISFELALVYRTTFKRIFVTQ